MAYLNTRDFIESVLDLSDGTTFPSNQVAIDQEVIQISVGDSTNIAPNVPFLLLMTIDKTSYELARAETVLVYAKDEINPDLLHVCRDWSNYVPLAFEDQILGTLDAAGTIDDTLLDTALAAVAGDFIRIAKDPQLYRVTDNTGGLTIEPPLQAAFLIGDEVRIVAHQHPSSKARIHVDAEECLFLIESVNIEELQDAVQRLQTNPFPQDLTGRTLTLSKHIKIGDLFGTAAAGMVKYVGGDFYGYDGADWLSFTEQGSGSGDTLPIGVLGNLLRKGASDWEATDLISVLDDHLSITYPSGRMIFDGDLRVDNNVVAYDVAGQAVRALGGGFDQPFGLGTSMHYWAGFGGVIVAQAESGVAPLFVVGGSLDGSEGPLVSSFNTQGHIEISATDVTGYEGESILSLLSTGEVVIGVGGDPVAVFEATTITMEVPVTFAAPVTLEDENFLDIGTVTSYPSSPENGMIVHHTSGGFRGYSAGSWHDLTGDTLTFSAPGTAWSTITYNPDTAEWEYTARLLLKPEGAYFDTAIVVGAREEEMAEQLGLIEFANNDFMGYVLDPDNNLIRVSLTNIVPEQRFPSAAIIGSVPYVNAANLWAASPATTFRVLPLIGSLGTVRVGQLQIGNIGGDGLTGTMKWVTDHYEYHNGTGWVTFDGGSGAGTVEAPTAAGNVLISAMGDDGLAWFESDAITLVDGHVTVNQLDVTTIKLGPSADDEYVLLTADDFTVPTFASTNATLTNAIITEATITTLNVTNLNIAGAGEEDPTTMLLSQLDLRAVVANAHLFSWVPAFDAIYLRHDNNLDYFRADFVSDTTYIGAINFLGGYETGDTVLQVDGFAVQIVAGNYVTIGAYTYVIESTTGTPTTEITLATPLQADAANNAVVTVNYGRPRISALGDLYTTRDLIVDRVAKFAYTIQLAAFESGYDGEVDAMPDLPGMVRYNGDFQGCLASGQWVSFTRTMADGNYSTPYGSMLWWDSEKWTKNTGISVTADGGIKLASNNTLAATVGAIRFTGTDFQGCKTNGVWSTLTSLDTLPTLPSGGAYENATLRWNGSDWVVNPYLNSDGVKTGVTLLQIDPYENFYDQGWVEHAGGYSIGADDIAYTGFTAALNVGDIVKFSNHDTEYEITADASGIMTIDPPLVVAIGNHTTITIQGELARPVVTGGQIRFNQNDFEGFVENIGWVSFTGHVNQLPTKVGDPSLTPGNILYFDGMNWVAYHYINALAWSFNIHNNVTVGGELWVDGVIHGTGVVVGSPQAATRGRTTAGYSSGYTGWIAVADLPLLSIGNRVRFTVAEVALPETPIYEISDVTVVSGALTQIKVVGGLQDNILSGASIFLGEQLDPAPYPGYIYYNHGTQRFRGFAGEVTPSGIVDGLWLDLVSPIQPIDPLRQGQTLQYNATTGYWNNNETLTIDNQILEGLDPITGYLASTLPVKIQEWAWEGSIEEFESGEETVQNYKFVLGCFKDAATFAMGYESIILVETNNEDSGSSRISLNASETYLYATQIQETLTVEGVAQFDTTVYADANVILRNGDLRVTTGNVTAFNGRVAGMELHADTRVWAGEYVRFGYYANLGENIPIGAVRYSTPDNAARGDWEGWDGEQWISFTAGFHGQPIWGAAAAGDFAAYDASYEGGKWRAFTGIDANFSTLVTSFTRTSVFERGLKISNYAATAAAGVIKFDGSEFLGSVDGVSWISLSHTGTSGLASATNVGDTIAWDGSVYQANSYLQVLAEQVVVNGVLELKAYEDLADPPAVNGGQVRYNQNDYEGYIEGLGWASFTGRQPFQNPAGHTGSFLYSNGEHWVANDYMTMGLGEFWGTEALQIIMGLGEPVHLGLGGQLFVTGGTVVGGALLIGATLPTFEGIEAQGYLRTQYTGDDARLEFFCLHNGEGAASWHNVMLGKGLVDEALAVNGLVFFDSIDTNAYVNTDLIFLEAERVVSEQFDVRGSVHITSATADTDGWRIVRDVADLVFSYYVNDSDAEDISNEPYLHFDGTYERVVVDKALHVVGQASFEGAAAFTNGISQSFAFDLSTAGNKFYRNVEIGTGGTPRDLRVYGDIIVDGTFSTLLNTLAVDRVQNLGYTGVGNGDSTTQMIGDVRYTGAKQALFEDTEVLGTTTFILKDVVGEVVPSIVSEARLAIQGHGTFYAITVATDLGSDRWEITISPALVSEIAEDTVCHHYGLGDWEGWTGNNWVSMTGGLSAGLGAVPRNQAFTSVTSITINHGLGNYPVVQCIDDGGYVFMPSSIQHLSANSFTVTFSAATTGTVAW